MKKLLFLCLIAGGCLFIFNLNSNENDKYSNNVQAPDLLFEGPAKYSALHTLIRTKNGMAAPEYRVGDVFNEFKKASSAHINRNSAELNWIERGPANVGGRTRGLIVDPTDTTARTWYAASVGGGVWRTPDAGGSWELLTTDIPNLSTAALAMSPANPDVIYAGTGEGFDNIDGITGSGIWKSEDRGQTWNAIAATINSDMFANVVRMVINPENENELVIAGVSDRINGERVSRIMKTTDGGINWDVKYTSMEPVRWKGRIQQIVHEKDNYSTMYATVNATGILKSTDAGENWEMIWDASNLGIQRIEMAISPNDAGFIYMSCESNGGSQLFFTQDTFKSVRTTFYENQQADWLAGQGWYDNTIAVHPYNDSLVWVAGAGPMLEIKPGEESDTVTLYDEFENGTSFLVGITNFPFTDEFAGLAEEIFAGLPVSPETTEEDLVDVVVYFGPGKTQKAHLIDVDMTYYNYYLNSMTDYLSSLFLGISL